MELQAKGSVFHKSAQTHRGTEIQQSYLEKPALILNAASQLFLTLRNTWEGSDPHYPTMHSALSLIIHAHNAHVCLVSPTLET